MTMDKKCRKSVNIQKHLDLLGLEVSDKVTKTKGVVTSVSFDLFGCIQAVVTPPVGADGKTECSSWFDVNRLTVEGTRPVMDPPNFDFGPVAEGKKGPANKPARSW